MWSELELFGVIAQGEGGEPPGFSRKNRLFQRKKASQSRRRQGRQFDPLRRIELVN